MGRRRSTRTRIRFQAKKAAAAMDDAMEHLAKMDVIAEGRHPVVDDKLPQLVTMLEGVKQVLLQFREEL